MENNTYKTLNKSDAFSLFAYAVMTFLGTTIVCTIFAMFAGINVAESATAMLAITAMGQLSLAGVAYYYCYKKNVSPIKQFKLEKKISIVQAGLIVAISVALITAMLPIQNLFLKLLEYFGYTAPELGMSIDTLGGVLMAFITICILPSICEEVVFRGIVGNGVAYSTKKIFVAALISGALFCATHMSPAQTLHPFVLGAVACLLFLRTGSFWACFLLHFANNFIASFVLVGNFGKWIDTVAKQHTFVMIACGIAAAAALVWLFFRISPKEELITQPTTTTSVFPELEKRKAKLENTKGYFMLVLGVAICVIMWVVEFAS